MSNPNKTEQEVALKLTELEKKLKKANPKVARELGSLARELDIEGLGQSNKRIIGKLESHQVDTSKTRKPVKKS